MNVNTQEVITTVKKRGWWLLASTAAFTSAAIVYAMLKPVNYDARQPLFVRDEGYGSMSRLGEFTSVDAMQTAQETILEVAKHPDVLKAALAEAGPPKRHVPKSNGPWPSPRTVRDFGSSVSVSAPGGAQFGRTEMIYLRVVAESQERAVLLADSICNHLIKQMKVLRKEKYTSIIQELTTTTNLARQELATITSQVKVFEASLGSDLAELRMSMDNAQGQSHLRSGLTEIDADLRGATAAQTRIRNEIEQLKNAAKTPALLITMPNQSLDSQPTLRKLKESYVEAQVLTSTLSGELSPQHPRLQAAIAAEERLKRQVVTELRAAIQSREVELKNAASRVASLKAQRGRVDQELAALATQRAEYANLLAALEQRSAFLKSAEEDLGNARASMLSSAGTSLIQKVKSPIAGIDPLGPGKTVIVLTGAVAGILTGLGLIYIFGIEAPHKRRLADQISYGRRNSDATRTPDGQFVNRRGQQKGRRASDQVPSQPAATATASTAQPEPTSHDGATHRSRTRSAGRASGKTPRIAPLDLPQDGANPVRR